MPRPRTVLAAAAVVALAASVAAGAAERREPAPPAGFRDWPHVGSMAVTDPEHGMFGFHDVYANPAALKVLKATEGRKVFPPGAQIVVSIHEVVQRGGAVEPGAPRRTVVKTKDPAATATGGWRFESFDPAGKAIAIDAVADCWGCHARAAETDGVITRYTR